MAKADELENLIEIWKVTAENARHFNELSVKSRQFGFSVVVAALGLAGVLLTRDEPIKTDVIIRNLNFELHAAPIIVALSAFYILIMRALDLGIYHKMLRGAITFGEDLEQYIISKHEISLNMLMIQAISHFSRYEDASISLDEATNSYKYTGRRRRSAQEKLQKFYGMLFFITISFSIILFIFLGNFEYIEVN